MLLLLLVAVADLFVVLVFVDWINKKELSGEDGVWIKKKEAIQSSAKFQFKSKQGIE